MSGKGERTAGVTTGVVAEPLERRSLMSAAALDVADAGDVADTGDVVLDWNEQAQDAMRFDTTYKGPVRAARNLAILHGAMYDAMNGVHDLYDPFFYAKRARAGTDADAAAAAAAYRVLSKLYPSQAGHFRQQYDADLAAVEDGRPEKLGVRYGRAVADRYLRWRRNDGALEDAAYEPGTRPGDWQPTAPGGSAVHPGAGRVAPFAIEAVKPFLPVAPPELTTREYTDAYNEVYDLGGRDSPFRSADQTEVGVFWAYDGPGMGTPVVLYNQVLRAVAGQEGNTPLENARLFAMANTAMADAGIVAWECKYLDHFWRPVTGVQQGDTDGNLDTVGDPTWEPLGAPSRDGPSFTPSFPAYVSGHSTFGAALFGTLRNFYGTDDVSFELESDELPGVVRTYDSFSAAEDENGDSRIYLGVHWRFDDTYGRQVGQSVADDVAARWFGPVG
ncbi:MAG: hypothetical protein AVDCRST_MAG64-530 [uncultured Phycisphaerae bacterium]|uniref:Uncharacterized protein n=1 Tax=uncultured Phycisphaerae bacterium TaxID=904963 RepID=A0A6J4N6K5_9BACT|nr:MAG: hypothetical protein AVDCRST_MAG64-530 [uncultured Phycisphaerae bacterium]